MCSICQRAETFPYRQTTRECNEGSAFHTENGASKRLASEFYGVSQWPRATLKPHDIHFDGTDVRGSTFEQSVGFHCRATVAYFHIAVAYECRHNVRPNGPAYEYPPIRKRARFGSAPAIALKYFPDDVCGFRSTVDSMTTYGLRVRARVRITGIGCT